MSAVRTALYARLAGDATLTGLLSSPDAIFHQVAPQTAEPPFVVFQRQAGTPSWQFAGAHVQQDVWQIKGVDRGGSASTAEAIAGRIAVLLTDAPLVIAGAVLLGIYRESDVDYLEQDGADSWHHCGSNYRVVTQPS